MAGIEQTWRWFGPDDPVSLKDIRQSGATGVVTALHNIPNGEVWPVELILKRKEMIEAEGLVWSVVESLPVSEDIKLATNNAAQHIANYCQSLRNLAACGIRTVTYNFMPVLDWTRTDLDFAMEDGSTGLRFDMGDLVLFDIHILGRHDARDAYSDRLCEIADARAEDMSSEQRERLTSNILAGLPGAEMHLTIDDFQHYLNRYDRVDRSVLRGSLKAFLEKAVPVAEAHDIRLAIHPDDPPMYLFGLPRIVSTLDDLRWLLEAVPSPANGLCFCTGSLGARQGNDVIELVQAFGRHIHFLHLRNIVLEPDGSFTEVNHLDGDVDMYSVLHSIISAPDRRKIIPMRPDHGHVLLDDASKQTNPGYSAIGRLRGLAELRGLIHAISVG